jgi:hypothetical protein
MADQPDKVQDKPRHCVYDGPAIKVPPGARVRPKQFARFDDPVIPRSYGYLTAGLTIAALALGLLLGRLLLS